jgi:hypothetical protein
MYSSLDLSGWAGEILEEYGYSGVTTGSVVSWLENNVGALNVALEENYYYITGIILPEMNQPATVVYTKMYECSYLAKQARQASYLGMSDWIEIEGQDQGKIRKVSKTEAAKELRGLSNDCKSELAALIKGYRGQISGQYYQPTQVIGDQSCFHYICC